MKPSNVALFVANLRLLAFDRRDDWPGITEETFATKDAQQNQRSRIRCVEWALFRLFELWDPAETREVSGVLPGRSGVEHDRADSGPEVAAVLPTSRATTVSQPSSRPLQITRQPQEEWRSRPRCGLA